MSQSPTSKSNGNSGESAPERQKRLLEPFDELRRSFRDFHVILESLLETSSEGSRGVPASSLPPSDSQAA